MTPTISVLIVDDHALVRRGFRRLLEDDPSIAVVGEAGNGEDAIRIVEALKPDVVVMDAAMPGTGGLAATRAILARDPTTKILMLSMHSEETLVRQALESGARGYILKNALDLDLAAAVTRIAAGETVVDPLVLPEPAGGARNRLTPRELEVLNWVMVGKSSWEISKITGCSEATVNFHMGNIRQKFNVNTRQQAVVRAISLGLITPEDHHR